MSKHKLETGKHVIDAVSAIGRALGYTVRTEMPVERRARPPAVDVAWFRDDELQYPLMIFEIESTATNAMANNPAKVFGQSSEQFQRPLFFFHIIIRAGKETSRIENLRGLFGTHNYRVYRLDKGMGTALLLDVLSQHRRVNRSIAIEPLATALLTAEGFETNFDAWVTHAGRLGLRGRYLADLARLAPRFPICREQFLRELRFQQESPKSVQRDIGYQTYLGREWTSPIHIGLLCTSDPHEAPQLFDRLRFWQEHSSIMPQIGPNFGLSHDYDEFMTCLAPSFWAFIAVLMRSEASAIRYIAQQCLDVLRKLERAEPKWSFFTALWSLHIAATAHDVQSYEDARAFVNERGGVAPTLLYLPPGLITPNEDLEWSQKLQDNAQQVPSFADFRLIRRTEVAPAPWSPTDVIDLAMRVLTDDSMLSEWGPDLVAALVASEVP